MLLKQRVKNKLYDRLHHGTVKICMGVTVIGLIYIANFGYQYYTQVKPERKLQQLKVIEEGAQNTDTAKAIAS